MIHHATQPGSGSVILTPPADLPTAEFGRVLRFPDQGTPESAVFSNDGSKLYVAVVSHPLELRWIVRPLVFYGSIGIGVIGLVMAFVLAMRVVRRARIVGERYCSRCNYHLRGALGEVCPECGSDVTGTGAAVGKSRRRTWRACVLWLAIAIVVPVIGNAWLTYGSSMAIAAPVGWMDVVERWGWRSFLSHVTVRSFIMEVDVSSGAVRELTRRRGIIEGELLLLPDGHRACISVRSQILVVDLRTGATRDVRRLAPDQPWLATEGLLGLTRDGRGVYVGSGRPEFSFRDADFEILRIDLESSEEVVLRRWDRATFGVPPGVMGWLPTVEMIPGERDRMLILPTMSTMLSAAQQPIRAEVMDLESGVTTPWTGRVPNVRVPMSVDRRRGLMWCRTVGMPWHEDQSPQAWAIEGQTPGLDASGRVLAMTHGESIVLRDLEASAWMGRIRTGAPRNMWRLVVGPGGHAVAAFSREGKAMRPKLRLWSGTFVPRK